MSWTKRQFIYQAFEAIGMAHYAFDLSPEELQSALRQLESMMATWNAKGLRLSYPIAADPDDADLDTLTDVPDRANEAIYSNLAMRIAPTFGKNVMPELKAWAHYAYLALLSYTARPPFEKQFGSTLPRGAGNKPWRENSDNFTTEPVDPLVAGPDDTIDFN